MLLDLINNFSKNYNFKKSEIQKIISDISVNEKQNIESINLVLSTDLHLNELKKKYFNKDHLTDVITFNLEDDKSYIDGEIYISMDRIIDNSNQFKCNINDELKRIIIHGVLHLFGYDDSDQIKKNNMTSLENYYMKKFPDIIIN